MSGYSCLDPPLSVTALDGRPLGAGLVSRVTSPVRLQTSEVFPPHPVSRLSCGPGVPLADPSQLDWITHTILEWGPTCHATCLFSSPHSTLELSQFPPEYYGLSEVFMKKRATVLPPHRSYDCAVDLLSGTCPPRRRIFSFSGPECVAMDQDIKEALSYGFIRLSSSPTGASCFFGQERWRPEAMQQLPKSQ